MEEISPDLLVSEFIDCIQERAEKCFKGCAFHAFIDWYVEAEFGEQDWKFTDGANDGGIDAVIWQKNDEKPPVVILQSKYSENVGGQKLANTAYRDFKTVVEAFHQRGEVFDEFLEHVASELRKVYLKAFKALDGNWLTEKKAFRLITTSKRVPQLEFGLIPRENFVYETEILRLYREYRRVWAPKARKLILSVHDKLSYADSKRRVTSYMFNARVSDFKKYLEHNDVGRLVARNIRYQVAGRSIGRAIRESYEKAPHDFWYRHNGITIVCDDFEERNRKATLTNPSVINGAQTLYAIDHSRIDNSPALVGTRVIVRDVGADESTDEDEWLQKIIRGVNTQNPVQNSDFRANEPEQVFLQSKFRDLKVFFERKRGEWTEYRTNPKFKGFRRLSLRRLGQVLMVVSKDNGDGVLTAKRGVDAIFGDPHYSDIFPPRPRIAFRFGRMYLAYRLFELVNRFGYSTSKEYRRRRHAFLNSLWILHQGITTNGLNELPSSAPGLRSSFDRIEKMRRTRRIIHKVTEEVWRAWRIARKKDPELYTPNNFFKSKYGNQRVLSLAYPKVRRDLNILARELVRHL